LNFSVKVLEWKLRSNNDDENNLTQTRRGFSKKLLNF